MQQTDSRLGALATPALLADERRMLRNIRTPDPVSRVCRKTGNADVVVAVDANSSSASATEAHSRAESQCRIHARVSGTNDIYR